MERNGLGPLFLFLLVLSSVVHGQDYDDEEDDSIEPGTGVLSLQVEPAGAATITLQLPDRPETWDAIRKSLATALRCPEQRFGPPDLTSRTEQMINRWPADRRESYLQSLEEAKSKEL